MSNTMSIKGRAEQAERELDALREEQWPRDDIKPGDDPAVHVVRESDVAAVEVQAIDGGKWWLADGELVNMCESPTENEAQEAVYDACAVLAGALAVRRAIKAGQDTDPVEVKAEELYGVANPGVSWDAVVRSAEQGNGVDGQIVREYRAIARHVLAEGGGHDE